MDAAAAGFFVVLAEAFEGRRWVRFVVADDLALDDFALDDFLVLEESCQAKPGAANRATNKTAIGKRKPIV